MGVRTGSALRLRVAGLAAVLAVGASGASFAAPAPAPAARMAAVDPALRSARGSVSVIVQAVPGTADAVAAAVLRLGGTVTSRLEIVDGLAARLDARSVDALARVPGVSALTANTVGSFNGGGGDPASKSDYVDSIKTVEAWKKGAIGSGVGVALIDTGISPMADLANHVVWGPDLSGEGSLIDTYGHGTVMAGIIAGSGSDSADRKLGGYSGVAPGATLYSVKVAGSNGAVDVTTILQAMHWVAAYAAPYNIRVVNLSWGTPSTQDPAHDPLNYAVERLWKQGIVVVVSAGNSGAGLVNKPGDDPMAITVGAYGEGDGAIDDAHHDTVPSWSSYGVTSAGVAKPDLVAPGVSLIATRSFGSTVETANPGSLIAPSYIRGSGTSEAAAVTSGAVAALLSKRPKLTPDQVKAILKATTESIDKVSPLAQGAGELRLNKALDKTLDDKANRAAVQTSAADGLGSIEGSRGGVNVETDCGDDGTTDLIQGEIDVRCEAWDGTAWTGTAWTGTAWTGTAWTGAAWTGGSWTGTAWTGGSWTGGSWTGGSWTGTAWTGTAWTGTAWTGGSWTGGSWSGTAWTGTAWTGSAWTGTAWHGTAWHGTAWHGTAWHGTAWHDTSS